MFCARVFFVVLGICNIGMFSKKIYLMLVGWCYDVRVKGSRIEGRVFDTSGYGFGGRFF